MDANTSPVMGLGQVAAPRPAARRPAPRRNRWRMVSGLFLAVLLAAGGVAAGTRHLWSASGPRGASVLYGLAEVEKGDVVLSVLEAGSLESANNTTVRCQVEALGGQVSSSYSTTNSAANRGASAKSGTSTSSTSTAKTATTSVSLGGGSGSASSDAADNSAAGANSGVSRPTIQSFSYTVEKHTAIRPTAATSKTSTVSSSGRSGGGGGGGGFGGGNNNGPERTGSTRILKILPEGTHVNAGDVVCTLDSATFRDSLQAQRITVSQAKSWVDQARDILDVSEISLHEYVEGVLPQDRLLCQQYIDSCETEMKRTKLEADWSKSALEKGLQSPSQAQAAEATYQRAQIALREAKGMQRRLDDFTAPRLIADLEAKIAAVKSDVLAQEAALELEVIRERRLEANVAHCELKAPREGIVVYVQQQSGFGQDEVQIQEGVAVREGQAIFQLPDPNHMQLKATINESKVALVKEGQRAYVFVDAFPDKPLPATVVNLTPIPATQSGPMSDVKVYSAVVRIDDNFGLGLRPGMSAEVRMMVEHRRDVPRLPLQALKRVGENMYVALPKGESYHWQRVEIGLVSPAFVEVKSGLELGTKVLADVQKLPAPATAGATKVVSRIGGENSNG